MNTEKNSKTLYDAAYTLFENREYQELTEVCSELLRDFPDSKEAKWAVKNFPIVWNQSDKTLVLKDLKILEHREAKSNSIIAATIIGFMIGVVAIAILHGQAISGEEGLGLIAVAPLIIGFFVVVSIFITKLPSKNSKSNAPQLDKKVTNSQDE